MEVKSLNEFFCPELFEFIKKKLYIYPLWTGYFLPKNMRLNKMQITENQPTRMTNNPVENWFNQLKNNILMCSKKQTMKKKAMPSELCAFSYNYIIAKYIENYRTSNDNQAKIENFNKKIPKEMWCYKK